MKGTVSKGSPCSTRRDGYGYTDVILIPFRVPRSLPQYKYLLSGTVTSGWLEIGRRAHGARRTHRTLCQLLSGSQPNTTSHVLIEPAWQGNRSPRTSGDTHHLWGVSVRGSKSIDHITLHFEFCAFATRFLLANIPRILFTPPLRRPDTWTMSGVGTTSWFFEPIST